MKKQILVFFVTCLFMIPLIGSVVARFGEPTPPNQPSSGLAVQIIHMTG